MSWIKDKKFVVGLTGGTLVGVALLYWAGSKCMDSYEVAKTTYQDAFREVESYAKMNPYPKAENQDSKRKSLDDYSHALDTLQNAFDVYRPKKVKNVSPQDFTNELKATNNEVRAAFKESGTKVPDTFFCGFETYKDGIANGKATGILQYQLEGIKYLMLALAKSRTTELKNLVRPALVEEAGGEYKPQPVDVARAMPMEITFTAPEKSVREFVSAIARMDGKFAVIRTIRISNTKKDPPRTADAKFESSTSAKPSTPDNIFFEANTVQPPENPASPPAPTAPGIGPAPAPTPGPATGPGATPTPAPVPELAPKPTETGRILAQVLGNEELHVFIRLDFLSFLPAQKLP